MQNTPKTYKYVVKIEAIGFIMKGELIKVFSSKTSDITKYFTDFCKNIAPDKGYDVYVEEIEKEISKCQDCALPYLKEDGKECSCGAILCPTCYDYNDEIYGLDEDGKLEFCEVCIGNFDN